MKVRYPKIGGIYHHYKGGTYEVLSMAKHSETDEPMVIYKSIQFGSVHARPLDLWFNKIEVKGEIDTERFVLIKWKKVSL